MNIKVPFFYSSSDLESLSKKIISKLNKLNKTEKFIDADFTNWRSIYNKTKNRNFNKLLNSSDAVSFVIYLCQKESVGQISKQQVNHLNDVSFDLGFFSSKIGIERIIPIYYQKDDKYFPLPSNLGSPDLELESDSDEDIDALCIDISEIIKDQLSKIPIHSLDIINDRINSNNQYQRKLIAGVVKYPPFCDYDDTNPEQVSASGLYPHILESIMYNPKKPVEIEWRPILYENMAQWLEDGKVDILVSVFATGSRINIGISCTALHEIPVYGLKLKENRRINKFEDLEKKDIRIGVIKSEIGHDWLSSYCRDNNRKETTFEVIKNYESVFELFELLNLEDEREKVDVVICDSLTIDNFLNNLKEDKKEKYSLIFTDEEEVLTYGNNTFIVHKNQTGFKNWIDTRIPSLKDLKTREKFKEINTKYKFINECKF